MTRDHRRLFTPWERTLLYHAADGRCQECDVPLDADWQADHDVAWADGGSTELSNGRALCQRCHLAKSNPTGRRSNQRPRPTTGIAGRFIKVRRQAGLSQLALSFKSGVNVGTISRLERGDKTNPGIRTVMALADGLGVTVDDLVARVFREGEGEQAAS